MKIGEVAEILDVSPDTIRRWERTGLAPKPSRDAKGWRLFSERDLADLRKVLNKLHGQIPQTGRNNGGASHV